jgi:hypothetical protein
MCDVYVAMDDILKYDSLITQLKENFTLRHELFYKDKFIISLVKKLYNYIV